MGIKLGNGHRFIQRYTFQLQQLANEHYTIVTYLYLSVTAQTGNSPDINSPDINSPDINSCLMSPVSRSRTHAQPSGVAAAHGLAKESRLTTAKFMASNRRPDVCMRNALYFHGFSVVDAARTPTSKAMTASLAGFGLSLTRSPEYRWCFGVYKIVLQATLPSATGNPPGWRKTRPYIHKYFR